MLDGRKEDMTDLITRYTNSAREPQRIAYSAAKDTYDEATTCNDCGMFLAWQGRRSIRSRVLKEFVQDPFQLWRCICCYQRVLALGRYGPRLTNEYQLVEFNSRKDQKNDQIAEKEYEDIMQQLHDQETPASPYEEEERELRRREEAEVKEERNNFFPQLLPRMAMPTRTQSSRRTRPQQEPTRALCGESHELPEYRRRRGKHLGL